MKTLLFYLTILFLLLTPPLFAQPYTTGEITQSITDLKASQEGIDLTPYMMLKQAKIVQIFNPDTLAVAVLNEQGDLQLRFVFDLAKGRYYQFNYEYDEVIYTSDALTTDQIQSLSLTQKHIAGFDIRSIAEEVEVISNFKCRKVIAKAEGKTDAILFMTDDIQLPNPNKDKEGVDYSILDHAFPIQYTYEEYGVLITTGTEAFSPTILHPEWMSTSTKGATPLEEYMEQANQRRERKENIVEITAGINLDKAQKMVELKLMESYEYESQKEKNGSIDEFAFVKSTFRSYPLPSKDTLISSWREAAIFNEEQLAILQKVAQREDTNDFERAAELIAIKHIFSKKETRENLVNNLKQRGYSVRKDKEHVIDQFVSGEIEFPDFFLSLRVIKALPEEREVSTDEEIRVAIEDGLNFQFADFLPPIKVSITEIEGIVFFKAQTEKYAYLISKNYVKSFDDQRVRQDSDPLLTNARWFRELLSFSHQIRYDHNITQLFTINSIYGLLDNIFFSQEEYKALLNDHPELKPFGKNSSFLISMPLGQYDPYEDRLPVSFPLSKDFQLNEQLNIKSFSPTNFGIRIKSDVKNKFLEHVTSNKADYGLSKEDLEQVYNYCSNSLFERPSEMMSLLPKLGFSLPGYRENLTTIDSSYNSFQQVFPHLLHFMKVEFPATNLRFDASDPSLLLMDYKGQTLSVQTKGGIELAVFKAAVNAINNPSRAIFTRLAPVITMGLAPRSIKSHYYYLTLEQVEALQDILDIKFTMVK